MTGADSRWRDVTSWRRRIGRAVISLGGLVLTVGAASAQSGGETEDGGGGVGVLGDIIIGAIKQLLQLLFSPIRAVIETHGETVLQAVVGTPYPNAVFSAPTNGSWPAIYDFYWQTLLPLALSLFGLAIGVVIFLEATSTLFSSYHTTKLKRRVVAGLFGLLSWWWLAALSLRFMDALAGFLVPSVSNISLFQTLSFSGMGILGTIIALMANFILFILIGLIYLARHVALYLFVVLMPILIVMWIPGVGPFALVSKFMEKLAGFYVPFLFMTVPVALLFRLGDLLGSSFGPSAGEFGAWLSALVIPLLAVLSPVVLFWQAGALLFVADRAAQHLSAQSARDRISQGRAQARRTASEGKNFMRGLRDQPAVREGQTRLDSGDSRAHAAGQRLTRSNSRLRDVLGADTGEQAGRTETGGQDTTVAPVVRESADSVESDGEFDRGDHADLRDPTSLPPDSDLPDDPPSYFQ